VLNTREIHNKPSEWNMYIKVLMTAVWNWRTGLKDWNSELKYWNDSCSDSGRFSSFLNILECLS